MNPVNFTIELDDLVVGEYVTCPQALTLDAGGYVCVVRYFSVNVATGVETNIPDNEGACSLIVEVKLGNVSFPIYALEFNHKTHPENEATSGAIAEFKVGSKNSVLLKSVNNGFNFAESTIKLRAKGVLYRLS